MKIGTEQNSFISTLELDRNISNDCYTNLILKNEIILFFLSEFLDRFKFTICLVILKIHK